MIKQFPLRFPHPPRHPPLLPFTLNVCTAACTPSCPLESMLQQAKRETHTRQLFGCNSMHVLNCASFKARSGLLKKPLTNNNRKGEEERAGRTLVQVTWSWLVELIPGARGERRDSSENQPASVTRSLVDVCVCGRDWIVVDALRMRCIHTSISE